MLYSLAAHCYTSDPHSDYRASGHCPQFSHLRPRMSGILLKDWRNILSSSSVVGGKLNKMAKILAAKRIQPSLVRFIAAGMLSVPVFFVD